MLPPGLSRAAGLEPELVACSSASWGGWAGGATAADGGVPPRVPPALCWNAASTEFETRCPNGTKVLHYQRAQLEKWAPYLNPNGLVSRLTTYEDLECKRQPLLWGGRGSWLWGAGELGPQRAVAWGMSPQRSQSAWAPVASALGMGGQQHGGLAWRQPAPTPTGTQVLEIKEWYQNREDKLEQKHINKNTGLIVDYFKPGHPQALRGVWALLLGAWGFGEGPCAHLRTASRFWWQATDPASPSPGSQVREWSGDAQSPREHGQCSSREVKARALCPASGWDWAEILPTHSGSRT